MRFKGLSEFVINSLRSQFQIIKNLNDVHLIERIAVSFSGPIKIAALTMLNRLTGHKHWSKLELPYNIKCLYDASTGITGSIESVVFRKECFLLDSYKPKRDEIIFDVGSYIGLYSILSSKFVGDKGVVYAIEPEPQTFSLLTRNLTINRLSNVFPINFALSDKIGKAEFYVPLISTAGSSFYLSHLEAQKVKNHAKINVNVRTLDDLIKDLSLNHIDVVKIDVEGAEISVLRGAHNSLAKGSINKFVIEVHKTVNQPKAIVQFLEAYHYVIEKCYDINESVAMVYAKRDN